jgi:hypothetical protein
VRCAFWNAFEHMSLFKMAGFYYSFALMSVKGESGEFFLLFFQIYACKWFF